MKKILLAFLLLASCSTLWAMSATVTGTVVTVEYDEPTQNEVDYLGNVTPLSDLAYTTVYYQLQGSTFSVSGAQVPASALTGGGHITKAITLPSGPKRFLKYDLWATASDTAVPPNESVGSNSVSVVIDKLAPAAPK